MEDWKIGRLEDWAMRDRLVSCPRNMYVFRCDQKGPPARREEGAYPGRYATEEQRGRRPIFIATLWAAASWLFFRVARSSRIDLDMLVARALKNSQLTGGESHAYFGDRTLVLPLHQNETHRQGRSPFNFRATFLQKKELLVVWRADRNDHPATVPQLVDQRLGDMIRGASHDDSIERRVFRQALVAVALEDFHIVVSKASQI